MTASSSIQDEGAGRAVTSATAVIGFSLSLLIFIPLVPLIGGLLGIATIIIALRHNVNRISKVLAALAILIGAGYAAWMVPALQRFRASADSTLVRNNLKQIGLALILYEEKTGAMPATLQAAVDAGCAGSLEVFKHPRIDCAGFDDGDVDATGGFYYFPLKTGGGELPAGNAPILPVAWEKRVWHPRGLVYVVYLDGHAWVCEFERLQADIEKHAALYARPPRMPEAAAD